MAIPARIIDYLQRNEVPFKRRPHAQAVSAQQLAASLHITGYAVAKSVLVDADGLKWIAVLPASETVDPIRLADVLKSKSVRLLSEYEFASIFVECETGAEPPFGRLYGLPVVVDSGLSNAREIIVRAGSQRESLQIAYLDFVSLERPRVGFFGVPIASAESQLQRELWSPRKEIINT
jgi:Ala-tRNA(Pro) deacylase